MTEVSKILNEAKSPQYIESKLEDALDDVNRLILRFSRRSKIMSAILDVDPTLAYTAQDIVKRLEAVHDEIADLQVDFVEEAGLIDYDA